MAYEKHIEVTADDDSFGYSIHRDGEHKDGDIIALTPYGEVVKGPKPAMGRRVEFRLTREQITSLYEALGR